MSSKDQRPTAKNRKPIDWEKVRRVLVIRLRSIGDTVLSTPSLSALRRFLPDARIDVLLEDWVAPVLDGFDEVDNVITISGGSLDRLKTAWHLRRNKYDVVFNLHGGTTSTILTRATGAKHRVGYENYQYSFLYNHLLSSSADFWQREKTHSAEQQLALIGFVGIPVEDRPKTRLKVTESSRSSLKQKHEIKRRYALVHPSTLFHTKQWSAKNFASVIDYLAARGVGTVAVSSPSENAVLKELSDATPSPIIMADDLTLPEITAVASDAEIFIGNDSGIAHIAAAVKTPTVVIFGSSNRDHWRPWTDAPNEIVFNPFDCQPCPGYECKVYGEPRCILSVTSDQVIAAVDRVLAAKEIGEPEPAF
jgi:predicted lipopolysaccharide heptosyltransferase III